MVLLLVANSVLRYLYPQKYAAAVSEYSKQYDVDESIIYAIIKCESGFNAMAYSKAGAIGLMQITPDTYKWAAGKLGEKNVNESSLYDAHTNIKYGCYIYSFFKNEFEVDKTALAAYNAGRGKVLSWLEDKQNSEDGIILSSIPYPETETYVKKVLLTQKIYKFLYNER